QRSVRALGIANSSEISWHFFRNRYPNLKATIKQLVADEKIIPVDIKDGPVGKGERYIHSDDVERLEEIKSGNGSRGSHYSPLSTICSAIGREPSFCSISITQSRSTLPQANASSVTTSSLYCAATNSSGVWIPSWTRKTGN